MAVYGANTYGPGGGDMTPPQVTNIVNPSSKTGFFQFNASDETGLRSVTVVVSLGNNPGVWLTAYADGAFRGVFAAYSTVSGSGTTGDPYHFRIRPGTSWPGGTNTVRPRLIDIAGNESA